MVVSIPAFIKDAGVSSLSTRADRFNCVNMCFVQCNKMTCPYCHTLSCYVCRQVVTGYEHFHVRYSFCPLFSIQHHDP